MGYNNEIWKDIEGWNNFYQISNFGRVKSLSREIGARSNKKRILKERIIKQTINAYGYPTIVMHRNGHSTIGIIHRLIAKAFIPNPENKKEVNHKNGVRNDNRLENLEWVTPSENMRHAFDVLKRKPSKGALGKKWPENKKGINHHRYGKKNNNQIKGSNHFFSKKVRCCTLNIDFYSIKNAADSLGLYPNQVSNVLLGKFKQTHGLYFIYI